MKDEELIAGLEDCSLPADEFHHMEHVRAAWLYLERHPVGEAMVRFPRALREYAKSLGKADRYHETITLAYLFIVNERRLRGETLAWEEFASANPDLLDWKESILRGYYREETLQSDLARCVFVMPDLLFRQP
jgi:hypothetical protein